MKVVVVIIVALFLFLVIFGDSITGNFFKVDRIGGSRFSFVNSGCSNGEMRCSGSNLQVCANKAWKTKERCAGGCQQRTKEGKTIASCIALVCDNPTETGSKRCNSGNEMFDKQILKEQRCADGRTKWVLDRSCGLDCVDEDGVVACGEDLGGVSPAIEGVGAGYLVFEGVTPVAEDLSFYFETDSRAGDLDIEYLGHSEGPSVEGDLFYGENDISSFDSDARTGDGWIVFNPLARASNDLFEISVPEFAGPFGGGGRILFETQRDSVRKTLWIGKPFSDLNDGFGMAIDSDDLEGMQDTTIEINVGGDSEDYDIKDEIRFSNLAPLSFETGLTYDFDEDWFERVFVPMERSSFGYYYVFEDVLQDGNYFTDASDDNRIEIEFLGKLMDIYAVSGDQMMVYIGQKFYMGQGDCVVVDGKEVCLVATDGNRVFVSVDGVRERINEGDEEVVNRIEIVPEDVGLGMATLYIGPEARRVYSDGDAFIGEFEDGPAWVWDLDGLDGPTPTIGIKWDLVLDNPVEDESPFYSHPLYERESICLPFDYVCMVFDRFSVGRYFDYRVEGTTVNLFDSERSLQRNAPDVVGAKGLKLVATGENVEGWGNKGFIFQDERGNMIATSAVVIAPDRDDPCLLNVYRMEGDGRYILEREIFGNMESIFRLTYLVGPNHEPFGVPVGLHWQCRQE